MFGATFVPSGYTRAQLDLIYEQIANMTVDVQAIGDPRYAPIANGVTNGNTHNHVGGDGAALTYGDVIGGHCQNLTIAAATNMYIVPLLSGLQAVALNMFWPVSGTIQNMFFRTATAQPASGTLVCTLEVNAVATALVITVPAGGAAAIYSNVANAINIVAGDALHFNIRNNAAGASATVVSVSAEVIRFTA